MQQAQSSGTPIHMIDVRPEVQYKLMSLPGAVHIPFEEFDRHIQRVKAMSAGLPDPGPAAAAVPGQGTAEQPCVACSLGGPSSASASSSTNESQCKQAAEEAGPSVPSTVDAASSGGASNGGDKLYVLCRRGNNSQRIVAKLREMGISNAVDVVGGIEAWAKELEPTMPVL